MAQEIVDGGERPTPKKNTKDVKHSGPEPEGPPVIETVVAHTQEGKERRMKVKKATGKASRTGGKRSEGGLVTG